ncbi:hypothetical protein [Streptomyces sp. R41]|uniref:Uncharacterized protein n=1 Tax=Streptomyces sp. R41 TaxID=3238632 RepID=A0AB39R5Y4_9ACTN
MTTFEDATLLGLAVQARLKRPAPTAPMDSHQLSDVQREEVAAALRYLEASGVLTGSESTSFQEYVSNGKLPEADSAPSPFTVGSVLAILVQHGAQAGALGHVVDAAVDGFVHAGPHAAVGCASIAAMESLRATKSAVPGAVFVPGATKSSTGGIKSGTGGIKSAVTP